MIVEIRVRDEGARTLGEVQRARSRYPLSIALKAEDVIDRILLTIMERRHAGFMFGNVQSDAVGIKEVTFDYEDIE